VTSALGLYTDLYELRMLESYLRLGMTDEATFSLYARPSRLRPFLVSAGLDLVKEVLDGFRFGEEEIAYLRRQGLSDRALEWLARARPSGELWAVPDGTVVLAGEPLLELTGPLPMAQLLETAVTNAMHGATLVATKAARLVRAARGRPVIDFGFRRAHGLETGIRAALAAYVGGAASTSNVEAGRRYGIPIAGTMAHSFVQAFDHELDALREFAADHADTTLLVDTYDPIEGVASAIRVAHALAPRGVRIGAIRIDSGDLAELGRRARAMLDQAGLREVTIVASGGLDEDSIDELTRTGAPYDAFGVGSSLVCSTDRPALDMAYKLVDYAGVARAKFSPGKLSLPGRKQVFRSESPLADILELRDAPPPPGAPLLAPVWRDGQWLQPVDVERARRRARESTAALPDHWFRAPGPDEPPAPVIGPALADAVDATRRRFAGG
jgi:nicotinate phosphoribosyltransferase